MLKLIPFLDQLFKTFSPQIQSIVPLVAGAVGGISAISSVASTIGNISGAIGNIVGAAGPAAAPITGAIQGIQSIVSRQRAKGLEPPLVDVAQVRALADIRRRRRTFETGTAITPFVRPIRQIQAQATVGALRAGAGQAGISRAQRIAGTQISDLVTRGQQRAQQLAQQEQQQQNLISRRVLELQRVRQAKEEGRAAQLGQSGLFNILSATQAARPPGQPPLAQNLATPFPFR